MMHTELLAALQHVDQVLGVRGYNPLRAVVETQNQGVPTSYKANVVNAGAGFDWTEGLFIIRTAPLLVAARCLTEPIGDFARRRLEELKLQCAKMGFTYIPRAREQAWLDGFREGIRAHVTSCSEVGEEAAEGV